MKEQFIYTNNPETKKALENLGYRLLKNSENSWIFINKKNNNMCFAQLDGIVLSNRLTF